jgi:hypothetical protein
MPASSHPNLLRSSFLCKDVDIDSCNANGCSALYFAVTAACDAVNKGHPHEKLYV